MGVIVAVANLKGGVGKTTISVLFAKYLTLRGYRILLIDADPQGTASLAASEPVVSEDGTPLKGIYLLLTLYFSGGLTPEVVKENVVVAYEGEESFYLLPNSIHSIVYDHQLRATDSHFVFLRDVLKLMPLSFDVVIVDCPPYVSSFVFSAFAASDFLLIPAETSPQGLPGVGLMLDVVGGYVEKGLCSFRGIFVVPAKVKRTKTSAAAYAVLKKRYGTMTTESYLPFSESVNRVFTGKLPLRALIGSKSRADRKTIQLLSELEKKLIIPSVPEDVKKRLVSLEVGDGD